MPDFQGKKAGKKGHLIHHSSQIACSTSQSVSTESKFSRLSQKKTWRPPFVSSPLTFSKESLTNISDGGLQDSPRFGGRILQFRISNSEPSMLPPIAMRMPQKRDIPSRTRFPLVSQKRNTQGGDHQEICTTGAGLSSEMRLYLECYRFYSSLPKPTTTYVPDLLSVLRRIIPFFSASSRISVKLL